MFFVYCLSKHFLIPYFYSQSGPHRRGVKLKQWKEEDMEAGKINAYDILYTIHKVKHVLAWIIMP